MFYLYEESPTTPSYLILTKIYSKVEAVLNNPNGDRQFKKLIGSFIDRNSVKLHTAGPQYMIAFTDRDKNDYFHLFGIEQADVNAIMKEVMTITNEKANFALIRDNPIYSIFYCTNRYYAKKKDSKSLNLSLAGLVLAMYPSMFSKYFKYGANEAVMQYTIDHLSNKFIIKKTSHIFGLLMATIQQCFTFHEKFILEGQDVAFVNYIMRIRNALNSTMKKIAGEFYKNYNAGLSVHTVSDSFQDNAVVDVDNNTNRVEAVTDKISMTLLSTGLDLRLTEAAARGSQVSVSDLRNYLNIIITNKDNNGVIRSFIESIVFLYIYDQHKTISEINSKAFLEFCLAVYKKANSNNKNIANIKNILEQWGEVVGLNKSFGHTALSNYKRAIYMFFVLTIQKYN